MDLYFRSPIDRNWSMLAKLDFLASPTLRVGAQVLFTRHDWRDYEFPWRYNLDGLPAEHRTSNRTALIVSHTPSDKFFYTASMSRYYSGNSMGDGSAADVPQDVPWQYDFYLRYIVQGQRAWWVRASQESYTAKFDGTLTFVRGHLLKFGGDGTLFNLNSNVIRFEPQMTFFGKPIATAPLLDFSSAYRYFPRSGSLYLQDKIDVLAESGVVNIGIRYDFLDTRAQRPAVGLVPTDSSGPSVTPSVTGGVKQSLSPRFGASFPVDERSSFFVNVGWYTQFPLFDELYTGLDRIALAKGVSAILGNPGLEPERSAEWEISYKRSFPLDLVASITYIKKSVTNMIDSKAFVSGTGRASGNYGFAEFVNAPYADIAGVEVSVARNAGSWLTGQISYTYMVAEGTSGSAYQGFMAAEYGLPGSPQIYPLSWDQRHAISAVLNLTTPDRTEVHFILHAHSGRPYTYYPATSGFAPINTATFSLNNRRMPEYSTIDVLVEQHVSLEFWPNCDASVYLDVRNILDDRNVSWMDANGRVGGLLGDPSGYYIGRRTRLGLRASF